MTTKERLLACRSCKHLIKIKCELDRVHLKTNPCKKWELKQEVKP